MQIFVKDMNGKATILEVEPTETVAQVKGKFQELEGLPVTSQRLIFQGVDLENDNTLEDYDVQAEQTLYVVARIDGGMQIFVKDMNGKATILEVEPTETVAQVKGK